MRCLSCNAELSDYEASRKALSGFYLDLCNACYRVVKDEIPAFGNASLQSECDEDTTLFDFSLDIDGEIVYNNNIDDEEDEH